MSDGTVLKPEKDFTEILDQQYPEIEALAKVFPSYHHQHPPVTSYM